MANKNKIANKHDLIDLTEICNFYQDFNKNNLTRKYKIYFNLNYNKQEEKKIIFISERILNRLTSVLNKNYSYNFKKSFWRILLSPLIIYLCQSLWFHYQVSNTIFKKKKYKYNIEKIYKPKISTSRDIFEYLSSLEGTKFINYLILSKTLKNFDEKKFIIVNYKNNKNYIKNILIKLIFYYKISSTLLISLINNTFIFGIKNINSFNKIKFKNKKNLKKNKNISFRKVSKINIYNYKSKKKFYKNRKKDDIIFELICENFNSFLPHSVFANFRNKLILNDILNRIFKLYNKKIIIGPYLGGNDSIKLLLSIQKQYNNNKLFIHQHGGYYGILKNFSQMNFIEYKNAFKFISWGWSKHSNYKIKSIPLPVPHISKLHLLNTKSKYVNNSKIKVAFVGTEIPKYFNSFSSAIKNYNINYYLNDKKIIVKKLNKEFHLYYKPYFSKNSINEVELLKNYNHDLKILKDNFEKNIFDFDIVILDHPGTLFNYLLGAKIPCMFLFNPKIWNFDKNFDLLLSKINNLNVIFYDPLELVKYLNKNYENYINNFSNLYNNKNIKDLINKYCNNNKSWIENWNNKIN